MTTASKSGEPENRRGGAEPAQAWRSLLLLPVLALALGGAALLPTAMLWGQAPPGQRQAAQGKPEEIKEPKDTRKRMGRSVIREWKEAEPEGQKIDDGKAKKSASKRQGGKTIRSQDSPEPSPNR